MNIPPLEPNEKKPEKKRSSLNFWSALIGLLLTVCILLLMAFGLLALLYDSVKSSNYTWVPWVIVIIGIGFVFSKFFIYLDTEKAKKLRDLLGNVFAVLFICGVIAAIVASCSSGSSSYCKPTRYIDC